MKIKKREKLSFEFINALSDKNRLKVILFLAGGERCVCEIFKHLKLPQNLVSHHLKILREKGLIENRKDGRWVRYSLNKKKIKNVGDFFNEIAETKETAKLIFKN